MAGVTKYTEEIGDKICEIIANSNKGLSTICKQEGMPSRITIHKWINDIESFANKYARAKEDQADFLIEEMIEIADTCRIGKKIVNKPTGQEITEGDMVERSKLMVDVRKWAASKLKPKKYGQQLDLTSGGTTIKQSFVIAGKEIEF